MIAADGFRQYVQRQGNDAKVVRVAPKGGAGDRCFTVVNQGSEKASLIADRTWRQFPRAGHQLRYRLVGTLEILEGARRGETLR